MDIEIRQHVLQVLEYFQTLRLLHHHHALPLLHGGWIPRVLVFLICLNGLPRVSFWFGNHHEVLFAEIG